MQIETILFIASALADGSRDERVLCIVYCQMISDGTIAKVHRAEMLRVNSAFRVNFIVPNKLVTNGGVQGDVVNRIDGQIVGDGTVAAGS